MCGTECSLEVECNQRDDQTNGNDGRGNGAQKKRFLSASFAHAPCISLLERGQPLHGASAN